jgi:hypothetical protein
MDDGVSLTRYKPPNCALSFISMELTSYDSNLRQADARPEKIVVAVPRVEDVSAGESPWSVGVWDHAQILHIKSFHPKSSSHRPLTTAKVLHDNRNIHVAFRVEDRFVRCVNERYQSMVCEDSCVEFFVEPRPGKGYFNFEMNGGGAMLLYFVEDHNPGDGTLFRKFRKVPIELGRKVKIRTSLPARIEPEIAEPITWTLQLAVPREVLEAFAGPLGDWSGQEWRGNLFKCGDKTSQPHWASWSPIGSELRFHNPACFAPICLR